MKSKVNLTSDNALFSSSVLNDVLVIREKGHILHMTQDINAIFSFYEYLESMLTNKAFKALVVFGYPGTGDHREHGSFLCKALASCYSIKIMDRLSNMVNQLIITLSTLNTITVYAGRGPISLFHLNLSLAYDYRLVGDDTVFENPNVDIGMITKGSGYFLPRMLGVKRATEVLQWKSFSAEDALQLSLVDRIVPTDTLEEETLRFVTENMAGGTSTLLGIRKLLKCDLKELQRSLEHEDQLIKERLESTDFRETFTTYCQKTFGCDLETLRNAV